MKAGIVSAFVVLGMLCFVALPVAKADDTPAATEKPKGHHNPIEALLKHASDLKLSDDQVTKLTALKDQAPGPDLKTAIMAILTPDQQTQWEQIRKDHKGHKPDESAK